LLLQAVAEQYECASLLITGNLLFGEWNQMFEGQRTTAALLDRLNHRCYIFEMNVDKCQFRGSMKARKLEKSA
jgi:DNA replication protein DnaC